MLLNYSLFYRNYGVRTTAALMSPGAHDINLLTIPANSIYHYIDYDGGSAGPSTNEPLFKTVKKTILVDMVTEQQSLLGTPRRSGENIQVPLRGYFMQNRRYKLLRDFKNSVRDRDTPVVISYGLLPRQWRYTSNAYTPYNKHMNVLNTVFHTLRDTLPLSDKQHFIVMETPLLIPSVGVLRGILEHGELKQSQTAIYRDPSTLLLIEINRWLAGGVGLFSELPKKYIHLVNLVFVESGKFFVLNLGFLNSFKDYGPDETEYEIPSHRGLTGEQVAARVLKMFIHLTSIRSEAAKLTLTEHHDLPADADVSDQDLHIGSDKLEEEGGVVGTDDINTADPHIAITPKDTPDDHSISAVDVHIKSLKESDDLSDEEWEQRVRDEDEELTEVFKSLDSIVEEDEASLDVTPVDLKAHLSDRSALHPEHGIRKVLTSLVRSNSITQQEAKKYATLATMYKHMGSPDGSPGTFEEFRDIKKEHVTVTPRKMVDDSPTLLDKSMQHDTLGVFDRKYVDILLKKDYANMALAVQNAGIALTNYEVETTHDIMGGYETHTFSFSPILGKASKESFKIPILKPDGSFITNGVRNRLRKQKADLPIRKAGPNKVAITSYYGKVFITAGRLDSKNYSTWLGNTFMKMALDNQHKNVTDILFDDCYDGYLKCAKSYSALAKRVKCCTCDGFDLQFSQKAVKELYPSYTPPEGMLVIGKHKLNNVYLLLDSLGQTTQFDVKTKTSTPPVDLEAFLGIDNSAAPVESATMMVMGAHIPIGVYLGYTMGLSKLIKLLGVKYREVPLGKRVALDKGEYAIAFSDTTYVFDGENKLATLILESFNLYKKTVKLLSVRSYDTTGAYTNLLETNGLGPRYTREIVLMNALFIDPITRGILVDMDMPIEFDSLLIKACEMLLTDFAPDEMDMDYMRIRGNERLPGAVYQELVRAIREQSSSLNRAKTSVSLNRFAVWKRISEDRSKMLCADINPITSIRELEAVGFAGDGGRDSSTLTTPTRKYHPNDRGLISESTTDNGDAGANVYLSAKPSFNSLRGTSKGHNKSTLDMAEHLSTASLSSVGAFHDDSKRINFIPIQQQHAIACKGYTQHIVRTGEDEMLAHRGIDDYAVTAEQDGVVLSLNNHGIIIKYADGKKLGYCLGRRYGSAAGTVFPHSMVSPLKKADQTFKKGDPIVYNEGFFEPDFYDKNKIVWKNAYIARMVLWENPLTLEDSSSLSASICKKLVADTTKVKSVVVKFDQAIMDIVGAGTDVIADTVLCVIADGFSAGRKGFDAKSIETLKSLQATSPRARVKGTVEEVEVYYYGEKTEMSPSLKQIADRSDLQLARKAKSRHQPIYSGKVDTNFRLDGGSLEENTAVIRFYITHASRMGLGDKGVNGNQLKTVVGEIFSDELCTEDGKPIEEAFGAKSVEARVVLSNLMYGTTATLLIEGKKMARAIYKGEKKY